MANTIRAAQNKFSGGLVMDLAPDTTPNEVLTSALNATLVTFNGNEMLLQNDMGNGRVETARLPEGYIPVGTCEFGDIIYIVSYNPLTNRSQIGCFPSPERNISTEEIGSTGQMLQNADFQEMNGNVPTGKLKTHSVKKILYDNKLNPGDKFIIYDTNNQILHQSHISDVGNTAHKYGAWPKWLKIHVVAIEDTGKINYLDSTLKWYNSNGTGQPADYFIQHMNSGVGGNKIDIDSYRTTLSSGYSVFQSKVSGKLALLIELEKITGFSCTYGLYGGETITEAIEEPEESEEETQEEETQENEEETLEEENQEEETQEEESENEESVASVTYKKYNVYWNLSWETENPNVNPSDIVLTKSEWVGKDKTKAGKYYLWKQIEESNGDYKLDEGHDGSEIPTAYDDENYYSATIDCASSKGTSYSDFINNKCYEVQLKEFLGRLPDYYGDTTLAKLNIVRDAQGYPSETRKYYINAATIIHNSDFSQTTVYTQKSVQSGDQLGLMEEIEETEIADDIVNNYFHHTIYKRFHEFTIPVVQTIPRMVSYMEDEVVLFKEIESTVYPDTTNLIYHYEVTPAMPYGLLDEFAVEGYIDFSKVGSGIINLTAWKYFIGENSATITIGMDAYPEDNKGIDSIVLEFYDNQGIAASYFIEGKESYSGQFTEIVPLNGATHIAKMRNTDSNGKVIYHCGLEASETDTNVCSLLQIEGINNTPVKGRFSGQTAYLNDAGTIYYGMLYLVKIIVKYCPKDALDNLDTTQQDEFKVMYRWLWTTTMFNEYYHSVKDYDNIKLTLALDVTPGYQLTNYYYYGTFGYNSPNREAIQGGNELYKYLSAKVQVVTDTENVDQALIDNPASGDISGGGESGGGDEPGGGSDEPEQEVEYTQGAPTVSVEEFVINFTPEITEIDWDEVRFYYQPVDGPARYLQKDVDFIVITGIGSGQLRIAFPGIGNSFNMDVDISSGAIKCGDDENTTIDMSYGFINGRATNG